MMNKFMLVGAFLFFSASSKAGLEEIKPECQLNQVAFEKHVSLENEIPEYFFKPIPQQDSADNRDDVSLILSGGNHVLDMKTGKMEPIPGPYDGVPTPDGEFIVAPAGGGWIKYFDRNGLGPDTAPLYDDMTSNNALMGVYHSVGILKKSKTSAGNKRVTYRIITDTITSSGGTENTLEFKEYTFEISPDGKKSLITESGKPKLLCGNFKNKTIKTPILSKGGDMLSAYNEESGTSVIYRIVRNRNGDTECLVKKDLGFAASKMEFSPDGKKVVFAMNSLTTTPSEVSWYSQPSTDTHAMNIFTYDFESDVLNKVTSQPNGNAYYPSFSNKGKEIVYLAQTLEAEGTKYAVNRVALKDTPKQKFIDFSHLRDCQATDENLISLLALGKLWESVCSNLSEKMTVSALGNLPLSLSKGTCYQLVKEYWKNYVADLIPKGFELPLDTGNNQSALSAEESQFYQDKFVGLSVDKLMRTCKSLKGEPALVQPPVILASKSEEKKVKVNPVQSCTQCHGSGERYIPFDKPAELGKWKKKMLLHVMTGNMPKNMNLTVKERTELINYLEELPDDK